MATIWRSKKNTGTTMSIQRMIMILIGLKMKESNVMSSLIRHFNLTLYFSYNRTPLQLSIKAKNCGPPWERQLVAWSLLTYYSHSFHNVNPQNVTRRERKIRKLTARQTRPNYLSND